MWWTDIEAAMQGAICICRRYCRYLGFSPVPIWQMIESIHMIWSRTMPKNLSLSVSVVICTRHSSQDVSSSFQHCITSCSRHAMASALSPAYTVLSWAALSCSWRTWQSVKASFSKQLNKEETEFKNGKREFVFRVTHETQLPRQLCFVRAKWYRLCHQSRHRTSVLLHRSWVKCSTVPAAQVHDRD